MSVATKIIREQYKINKYIDANAHKDERVLLLLLLVVVVVVVVVVAVVLLLY